jgi:UV DNA damage endonuclease
MSNALGCLPMFLDRWGPQYEAREQRIFKNHIRLGYACINMNLRENKTYSKDFPKGVCVNRSCIAKTFRSKGKAHAMELAQQNLEAVIEILHWNAFQPRPIQFYRLSSDMFPHLTNPEFCKSKGVDDLAYDLAAFQSYFDRIGDLADRTQARITFHPGPYNQVGSPHREVFEKTKKELNMHASILDRCHRDLNSVMVVHGGGVYNNKALTKERWIQQFRLLPSSVQERLVIENCEHAYHIFDVMEIAEAVQRPVVFDTHHYNCYNIQLKAVHKDPLDPPSSFLDEVVKGWTNLGLRPKFHVSDQAPKKRLGAHADYVRSIPSYLFDIAEKYKGIDIMIEAKQKERAVQYLQKKYKAYS